MIQALGEVLLLASEAPPTTALERVADRLPEVIAAFASVFAAFRASSAKTEAKAANARASEAADLSRPTGNGFAQGVRESLVRLEGAVARLQDRHDEHLRDHAIGKDIR